jgi:two-component system, cell cycle sensor histidine kinase and response regulator CckA
MERTDLDQWRGREVARLLALVETQRRYYQEIVASIPVGLMVLSADLSILLANGAARRIFGLHTGESPRRMDTILPAALLDRIEDVLKTGANQTGVMIEGRDQRRLRVAILAIRGWDEEAAAEALINVEDLTGVEMPEQAARVIETPMETAPAVEARPAEVPAPEIAPLISAQQFVENVDAVLWAVELPSMNFVFVSPQAETLLGFAPEHWTSHPSFWLDRIVDSDRDWVAQSYSRAIESGAPHSCEFQAITASGPAMWLREYARLVPAAEGEARYLIGLSVDVSERRMLEDQLVQSERVEAVSRLASRMAHDLNNMLMILTGYSEELLTSLPAGSTLRADVQEIMAATDRMTGLTTQLLSFARRQPGTVTEIDLEATLERFGPRWSALLGRHIGIEFNRSGESSRVRADAGQLEQVMTAIVERARQGMHTGEKMQIETSRLSVSEDLRRVNAPLQRGDYAVVSIVAPGPPLESDAKIALFECSLPGKEPWDDVAATLSRAYGILRQWGGDISVSSARAGLTFRVFLPRVEAAPSQAAAEAAPAVEAPTAAPEPAAPLATILVVEDEAGIRALVRKILRRQGYEVLEAANGQDALALCRENGRRVDLLITDLLMPQMGGRELVERLQTQGQEMKVLYVSGYTDDATVYSGDLPPGTAFLQKPFTLGSLLDKVKEVLAK